MDLRAKLSCLFGVTVVIVLGLLWTQQVNARRIETLRGSLEWSRNQLIELNSLVAAVSRQINLVALTLGHEHADRDNQRRTLQRGHAQIESKFYSLERHLLGRQDLFETAGESMPWQERLPDFEARALADLRQLYSRIHNELKLIQNLDRRQSRELAGERFQGLLDGAFGRDFVAIIEAWIEYEDAKLRETDATAETLHARANAGAMLVSVFGLMAVLALAYTARVSITNSLENLLRGTEAVAAGRLDTPIKIAGGDELARLGAAFNDMTARLHETMVSRQYLNNIINSMADTLIVVDQNGLVREINRAAARLLGYEQETAAGLPMKRICPHFNLGSGEIEAGTVQDAKIETTYHAADGRGIPVLFSQSLLRNGNGDCTGAICLALDITDLNRSREEQRDLEKRLAHAHKMEAVGQLAGGIAHDFNNQLTSIMGYAELLSDNLQAGSEEAVAANIILESSRNSSGLIQQLLSFARKKPLATVPLGMHSLISQTMLLLQPSLDRRIRVSTDLQATEDTLMGDATSLQNMLLNLAFNARDALAENGGEIIFRTANSATSAVGEDRLHPGLAPGRYLKLTVADNGCGIPPENLARIFEPLFTTKPDGKGTGMGLATVYGSVKSHGGDIAVSSSSGNGTSFEILLPLLDKPVA